MKNKTRLNKEQVRLNFETRFKKTDGCWLWTASTDNVYGNYYYAPSGKTEKAHRVSYLLYRGEIMHGNVIMHKCDTPLCVNPSHLEQGTHKENSADCIKKGRNNTTYPPKTRWNKLTEKDVIFIKKRLALGESCLKISKDFGVTRMNISAIKFNRSWKRTTV